MDALPVFDLVGDQIKQVANSTSDEVVFAQALILEMIGSQDHAGKNFVRRYGGDELIAIDFASSPSDEVWDCAPIADPPIDHWQLANRLASIDASTKQALVRRLQVVDVTSLKVIVEDIPEAWASRSARDLLVGKLLERKEVLLARYG
jgi:hypothetical protein